MKKKKRTSAGILFDKLFLTSINRHSISIVKAFSNFYEELDNLNKEFNKKKYEDEYIISLLYSNPIIKKSQIKLFCRLNIHVAFKQFKSLTKYKLTTENKLDYRKIKLHKEIIKDYIFDLIPFVHSLKRDKEPNYIFLDGGKNNNISTFELYNNSCRLLYNSTFEKNILDNKLSYNLALFSLRQALEIKFKGVVGINDICDENLESPKIRHDFYPNFIIRNKTLFKSPYNNLKYLLMIYKWTNYYIHYGLMPRIWDASFAIHYSGEIFSPSEFKTKSGKNIWSINGSVIINEEDVEEIKTKFEAYCKSQIKDFDKYKITYSEPEAIINS